MGISWCEDTKRFLFAVLVQIAAVSAWPGGIAAQTIHVNTAATRAIAFDPDKALGTSVDILPANQIDTVYSAAILKESLSAGWGPITYRQNTELTTSAWHW